MTEQRYGCLMCYALSKAEPQQSPMFARSEIHACQDCKGLYCAEHWPTHLHFYPSHKEDTVK